MISHRPDYHKPGDIVEIPKLSGRWMRLPDNIRYDYDNAMTTCPVCKNDAAGVPWGGWFTCELSGCCIALVDSGEAFVSVKDITHYGRPLTPDTVNKE